jgi:Na+/H+ antiporter NhaC
VGLFALTAQKLGIEKDGYSMFFDALTFRFYCILMLSFVFGHILFGCDFGPMKEAQKNPPVNTDITALTKSTDDKHPAGILNALVPLAGLVLFHISGLWIDGGGPAKITTFSSIFHWQYWRQVIGNTENSILILIYAALFGLTLAALCATLSHSLRTPAIIKCIIIGAKKASSRA